MGASASSGVAVEVRNEAREGEEAEAEKKEMEKWDELALFDHLQPVFDGRFTGRRLLGYIAESGKLMNENLLDYG